MKRVARRVLFARRALLARRALFALLVFGCAAWLAGCSALRALDPLRDDAAIDRATAVYLAGGQPRTLDPATTYGDAGDVIGHVFSGLVRLAPDLTVQPELAIGWDVDDAGTTITFFLHPNARFHDGRAVTADDVRFTWERALKPATGSDTALTYLGDIVGAQALADGSAQTLAGVRVIDERTLAVTIDAPKPYFLAKLTYPVSYIVDRQQVDDPDWQRAPNGSGPFRLQTWIDDTRIVLVRNDDYYGVQGNVAHVVYEMGSGIPLSLYEQGQIDLVGIGGDTLLRAQDPNDPLAADLRTIAALCTTLVGLNTRLAPFDDPRVRLAFNLALDRERLIDALFDGNALLATGILPPGIPGAQPRAGYPFDPARANALLDAAGFDRRQPLIYTTSGYGDPGLLPVAVGTLWTETLGVTVEIQLLEPFEYPTQLYAGNIGNFYSFGWCADYADPENFLDILFNSRSAQNLGGYRNAEIDAALVAARSIADPAARLARYGEIEQLLLDDAATVIVAHGLTHALVSPRLQNYVLTPIGVPQWQLVTLP